MCNYLFPEDERLDEDSFACVIVGELLPATGIKLIIWSIIPST